MKSTLFFITILSLLLAGCSSPYFEFDTVSHYAIHEKYVDPQIGQDIPALAATNSIPEFDADFENKIKSCYVFKSDLDAPATEKIRKIYRSKIVSQESAMESPQLYEHFLVFKKDGAITGASKISFGSQKDITLTQFRESEHIDMDDFDALEAQLE